MGTVSIKVFYGVFPGEVPGIFQVQLPHQIRVIRVHTAIEHGHADAAISRGYRPGLRQADLLVMPPLMARVVGVIGHPESLGDPWEVRLHRQDTGHTLQSPEMTFLAEHTQLGVRWPHQVCSQNLDGIQNCVAVLLQPMHLLLAGKGPIQQGDKLAFHRAGSPSSRTCCLRLSPSLRGGPQADLPFFHQLFIGFGESVEELHSHANCDRR